MTASERQPSGRVPASLVVEETALFLDLDGVIVPIAERPDAVRVTPTGRLALSRALEALHGRVAVISGRTIEAVDEVLGGAVPCIAGVHGLQRRTLVGGLVLTPPHARVAEAASVLQALARACPGLLVEAKGPSVAIHYRAAPDAEAAVIDLVERLSTASGLQVQAGKMVMELRTPGPDKGSALDRFMLEAPFAGARPIFIGDDLTDEPGFVAAQAHGGLGVLVGEPRETAAQGRLSSPEATMSWIMRSLSAGRFDFEDVRWAA